MAGLETFAPVPRTVTVGGRAVDILPLRLRSYTAFVRAVTPVLPQLLDGDILGAVESHETALLAAVSIGTGIPEPDLGELWPDEFVALASAVVEVNADFFLQRVLPALRLATDQIGRLTAATGTSSLPGSDDAATA